MTWVLAATALAPGNAAAASPRPAPIPTATRAGAPCRTAGATVRTPRGFLECREVAGGRLRWVALSRRPPVPQAPPGGANLDECRLADRREPILQPWNIGFPRGDRNGTPLLPASGTMRVQLIAVDFSDATGTGAELAAAGRQIAEFSRWFEVHSHGALRVEWQFPPRWYRMSRTSADYQWVKGDRQRMVPIAEEMLALADAEVDFAGSDSVFVLLPRSIVHVNPDLGDANVVLRTADGPVRHLWAGGRFFYQLEWNAPRELWSFWVHEYLHPMGIPGHGLRSNSDVANNQNGRSVVLNAWDRFLAGWSTADDLYCMPAARITAPLRIELSPLERTARGLNAVMIPVSDTQVIVVESRRAEGWGARLGRGAYGILATVIDVSRDVDRSSESGSVPGEPFPSFATPLVPPGTPRADAHRREYLLRMGESVEYSGVRIDFVASGDNDTVLVVRTG